MIYNMARFQRAYIGLLVDCTDPQVNISSLLSSNKYLRTMVLNMFNFLWISYGKAQY